MARVTKTTAKSNKVLTTDASLENERIEMVPEQMKLKGSMKVAVSCGRMTIHLFNHFPLTQCLEMICYLPLLLLCYLLAHFLLFKQMGRIYLRWVSEISLRCACLLMWRLANDVTVKEFQQKIRDGQKDNEELTSKLAKKERECEVKVEEQVNIPVWVDGPIS